MICFTGLSFLLTCSAKWNHTLSTLQPFWRRRRDSNPRYPFEVYTLSRRAPSTARTLLLFLIPSGKTRPQSISSERRGNVRIFSEFSPISLRKIVFLTFIRSDIAAFYSILSPNIRMAFRVVRSAISSGDTPYNSAIRLQISTKRLLSFRLPRYGTGDK